MRLKPIVTALCAGALLAASPFASAKELKAIGVTVGDLANPFFVQITKGAELEARKLAGDNVKVTLVSSGYDLGQQVAQIDNFIAAKVDMIILNAADSKGIGPAVKRAKEAGIVVVAVDVAAEGADATITSDNTQAGEQIRVAIGHDSRNNSRMFAEHVADIFASNGFTVFLFDALRPTPELSFAIRELKCQSGVVVTASHNPKEYNGYKAYWSDGSQVTAPHDKNIIDEVEKITEVDQVLTGRNPQNIHALGKDFDELYLNKIYELSLSSESVKRFHDMKIVYSPMHGAGVRLVPASLKKFGFTNVIMVKEQAVIDGNFPTVESPNPEERKTMSMAIDLAAREGADLVLATDPDSDRIGVALPDENGEYVLLNGNQTLVLLMTYQLTRWAELGRLNGHQYVIKTIVTTEMVDAVADYFKVKCYDCLTGFKYIAKIIRENEGKAKYIGGGEESFGYLAGDYVRDKDAVSACSLAAEAAAWAMDTMGLTLYEWLQELYVKYGFYREGLVSVVRKGKEGAELIQKMMVEFRANPPKTILGSPVVKINDFLTLETTDVKSGAMTPIVQCTFPRRLPDRCRL